MQTIWLGPTNFVTGDPTLRVSYPFVSHPSTIVSCTAPADFKWISMGLRLPPDVQIEAVTVCYQLSNARSFISQVRLVEMTTPDRAIVVHDDPTHLTSTAPATYSSAVPELVPSGALMLELRLNFQNTSDEILLGAAGVSIQTLAAGRCVNSIADLKALPAGVFHCVELLGYYAPGDGGGGEFFWDASSTEPDNRGTIIIPDSNPTTGRWKRVLGGPLSVKWFGAKGNDIDDTDAIEAAMAATPSAGESIIFPGGMYRITSDITLPATISTIFDRGASVNPASGVTVTANSEMRAGLFQIFTVGAGAGLIRGFLNTPYLLPEWWGAKGDGQNNDGPAIQAALDAVPAVGGTILLSSKHYCSNQGLIVKAHGTMVKGTTSAYGYGANSYATQVEFKNGVTGFDFCMGLAATDKNYYANLRRLCKISQLAINGGNNLQNGIRMASTNLIEEVSVCGCNNAGILLDNGTNSVHINKSSAGANDLELYPNHIGLYVIGNRSGPTTIWSCMNSNWRGNDIGVRIEGGVLVHMQNCVIESNHSYGMEIYGPADADLHHLNFKSLWFENNCCQSNDQYQLYIHSDATPPLPATHIRFEQCFFNASSSTQSWINVQGSQVVQFITFDECEFYPHNQDLILLGAGAADTYFKNCTGLLADIGTKGANTAVIDTGTGGIGIGVGPPASGTYSTGDILWNSAPAPGGNIGWVCIAGGTPGVWKGFGTIAN